MKGIRWLLLMVVSLGATSCVTTRSELLGVAELPSIDRSVLVTGGAFIANVGAQRGTFARTARVDAETGEAPQAAFEGIAFDAVVDALQRGQVFQRVVADDDEARRRFVRNQLRARSGDPRLAEYLRQARADGFDLLLVIEELNDGPIESQGTNGRWPVTFVTWILLGVGAFIPDHTFELRATMRVTLRELQTGRVVAEYLPGAGPVDLALTERTDLLGLVMSAVVPPFWVPNDEEAVDEAVRTTTERRMLLSLARDLKTEQTGRLIDSRMVSTVRMKTVDDRQVIEVDSREGISVVQLAGSSVDDGEARLFQDQMLASRTVRAGRYLYSAPLPKSARDGLVQVQVGTLSGAVSSGTFAPGGRQ